MLKVTEIGDTIGVVGFDKNGLMIKSRYFSKVGRQFTNKELIEIVTDNAPRIKYIKIFKKTPIDVPFLGWYRCSGRKIKIDDLPFHWEK